MIDPICCRMPPTLQATFEGEMLMARRIVLHAPTEGALERAISNARNILTAEPGSEIEIVVNADGVAAALTVRDAELTPMLRYCANTLRNRGLEPPDGALTVDTAMLHLANRQAEGWAYIRA